MTMFHVPVTTRYASTPSFSHGDPGEQFYDDALAAQLLTEVRSLVNSRNQTTGNLYSDLLLGYRWSNQTPQPVPPPVVSEGVVKHSNGHDWAHRRVTKKIVMSPYLRWKNTIVHDPVKTEVDHGFSSYVYADLVGMGIVTLQPLPEGDPKNKFPYWKGLYILGGLGIQLGVYLRDIGLILANIPILPDHLLSNIREGNLIKSCIRPRCVTSALADANSGTLDLLTEMAELPSTLTSVFQALKTLARMVKDLRKRELQLTKQHDSRRRQLRKNLEADIAKLQETWSLPMSPSRRHKLKKAIQRRIAKLEKSYARKNREIGIELADAIAHVWLTYRYTMMPQIYLIDDLMRTLGALYSDYYTAREKDQNVSIYVPQFDGYTADTAVSTHRCVIKTMVIASNNLNKLGSLLSANILVTAWELLSKSLIVDWILNIGDLLGAMINTANYDDRKTSYSIRIEKQQIRYTHKVSGAAFIVIMDQYERDIIDPTSHIGISFQDDWFNQKRFADLAAFGLPALKKMLRNVT